MFKYTHTHTYFHIPIHTSNVLDFINSNMWSINGIILYTWVFRLPFSSPSSRTIDIHQSYLKLTTVYSVCSMDGRFMQSFPIVGHFSSFLWDFHFCFKWHFLTVRHVEHLQHFLLATLVWPSVNFLYVICLLLHWVVFFFPVCGSAFCIRY